MTTILFTIVIQMKCHKIEEHKEVFLLVNFFIFFSDSEYI